MVKWILQSIKKNVFFTEGSTQCKIGNESVDEGEYVDYPDLCIRLTCKSDGRIEPSTVLVI